jgi:hypothetical protein
MSPDDATHYMLFGSSELDIASCRALVEDALAVAFEGHESSFVGEYYLAGLPGGEQFELRTNRDAEDELTEPEFSAFVVLLYANKTSRPDAISEAIGHGRGLVKLRSDEITGSSI